jgi:hypothetical protein
VHGDPALAEWKQKAHSALGPSSLRSVVVFPAMAELSPVAVAAAAPVAVAAAAPVAAAAAATPLPSPPALSLAPSAGTAVATCSRPEPSPLETNRLESPCRHRSES